MKHRAEKLIPHGVCGNILDDPKAFFHKGLSRNFKEVLPPEQIKRYETIAREKLGEECARWLEEGTFLLC